MKQAFVTGGSGFLGRNLIKGLGARGAAVRALARSETASEVVRNAGAEAVRGDLDDVAAMRAGMSGCDVVFHSAAFAKQHGPRDSFFRGNVDGTKNALAAAQAAGVRRFVHVGTEAVLGDGKPIVRADETRPFPKRPAGLYPLTKGLAEMAVLAANGAAVEARDSARERSMETLVIRPRLIWGLGDSSLLPELVATVKDKRWAWIDGGHYLTSTCHVDNVVEGALLAAEKGRAGEVYFLTDGEPVEFRSFMDQLLRTQGVDPGQREVPRWVVWTLASLTGWMRSPPITKTAVALAGVEVTVDDGKARRELGYVGATTRAAGFAALQSASPRQ